MTHNRATELYCKSCKVYLCPECATNHFADGKRHDIIHILNYAIQVSIPTLDRLINNTTEKDSEINLEAMEFIMSAGNLVSEMKKEIKARLEMASMLKSLTMQLEKFSTPIKQQPFAERIRKGLTTDKTRLEEALEKRDLKIVVTLTKKIEAEGQISQGEKQEKELISNLKTKLSKLDDTKAYKEVINEMQMLAFKCQHLRLNQYITGWRCDKRYLTSKMTLSKDGLVYGNQAGNGYPAIIGDIPFGSGVLAYEVTPSGLCCAGKEGFGIIELSKYKEKFEADSVTPTVHDYMLGLFYNNCNKNMAIVNGCTMKNDDTYLVKADMTNLELTIKGPNCSLKAGLKPNTIYVPCFSCGCRNNKLVIKPVEVFDD